MGELYLDKFERLSVAPGPAATVQDDTNSHTVNKVKILRLRPGNAVPGSSPAGSYDLDNQEPLVSAIR
jgi:hypothetical protein